MDPHSPANMAIGLSVYEGEWLEQIKTALDDAVHKALPYDLELQMTTHLGNQKWVRTIGVPVIENDAVIRVRGSMQDITAQKSAEEKVHWLAHFDPLTGLPNRTLLNDRLNYAIRIAYRTQGSVALLYLDLDHFKNINDTLGHHIGDALLVQVALRIQSVIREADTLSRQGGDEFMILLSATDADGAAHVAEKLIESISQPYEIHHHELTVTPSIGIALYSTEPTSPFSPNRPMRQCTGQNTTDVTATVFSPRKSRSVPPVILKSKMPFGMPSHAINWSYTISLNSR
jgi:diguanylate cyclase (GGDEF)-like protein